MSAPKPEAGLSVERQAEFHCDVCGSDGHDTGICEDKPVRVACIHMPGCWCADLERERDEARAAVERYSGQPSRAKVWEETLEAVAWTMSTGGPPDLAYVAEHNPYRAASSEGA